MMDPIIEPENIAAGLISIFCIIASMFVVLPSGIVWYFKIIVFGGLLISLWTIVSAYFKLDKSNSRVGILNRARKELEARVKQLRETGMRVQQFLNESKEENAMLKKVVSLLETTLKNNEQTTIELEANLTKAKSYFEKLNEQLSSQNEELKELRRIKQYYEITKADLEQNIAYTQMLEQKVEELENKLRDLDPEYGDETALSVLQAALNNEDEGEAAPESTETLTTSEGQPNEENDAGHSRRREEAPVG